MNSQGIAFVHNLIAGPIANYRRRHARHAFSCGPFHGHRRNVSGGPGRQRRPPLLQQPIRRALQSQRAWTIRCFPASPPATCSPTERNPRNSTPRRCVKPDFDPGIKLTEKSDGWYLTITEDPAWRERCKTSTRDDQTAGQGKGFRLRLRKRRRLVAPHQHRLLRPQALQRKSLSWAIGNFQTRARDIRSVAGQFEPVKDANLQGLFFPVFWFALVREISGLKNL